MTRASTIIFQNSNGDILLHLRDDKATIPDPNMWDLLGGWAEAEESPEQTIVREMQEEIELDLKEIKLFRIYQWPDHIQSVFCAQLDIDPQNITLHEGQKLQYFKPQTALAMKLANTGNQVLRDFLATDDRLTTN